MVTEEKSINSFPIHRHKAHFQISDHINSPIQAIAIVRNANGTFQISSKVACLNPQKERLTKDVRYQEFNEVTPDRMCGQGLLHA